MQARTVFDPPLRVVLALVVLFAGALWLRLSGTAWDGWANLHPDERHMVFVSQDIQRAVEAALADGRGWWSMWFGPKPVFDPRAEGRLYVYGDLPLIVTTLLSRPLGMTDWGSTTALGRMLTATVDASAIIAVFILALRLTRQALPALAAASLAAVAPTSLQLANFYTVDAWLAALCLWTLVPLAALARPDGRWWLAAASGLLAGLALASKVTAVALALPALIAVLSVWRSRGWRAGMGALLLGLLTALLTFRLFNPSAFTGPGFWGLWPSAEMIADFVEVRAYVNDPNPPSNWFWMAGYPTSALVRDMVLFGTGPVLAVLAIAGILRRPENALAAILLAALLAHVALNATGLVTALRYLAPIVPLLAVLASRLLHRPAFALVAVALSAWWGWGTVRLHDGQHPRLIATEWMRALPPGTAIAFETGWDEGLPVWQAFPARDWSQMPGPFRFVPLGLTDFESPDSAARIAAALDQAQYVSISSGRVIEVMPRLPERFPTVTRYYEALLDGRLCFRRVLYLDRGYPLPGLPFNDSFAQEPWRVYDHPIVQFWQKEPCFRRLEAQRLLSGQE